MEDNENININENEKSKINDFDFAEFNEEILQEVNEMYNKVVIENDSDTFLSWKKSKNVLNLKNIAQSMKEKINAPSTKATVLIIGNISAGKSTFINWLTQEAIQKTGMAIETSGFSIVQAGRHLKTLEGPSNLLLNPYLTEIVQRYDGLIKNMCTKTCPIKKENKKNIKMLNIIDTPGLADGELEYPFDVNDVILDLARISDIVLVFFDPIGQALSKRTLTVLKNIYDEHPDIIRLCLTKVDDIPTEEERIKIMCQTTQTLTSKIHSRHGFDLIPIYVPGAKDGTYLLDSVQNAHIRKPWGKNEINSDTGIVNRVHDLVCEIEKAIEKKVQVVLNYLKDDTELLISRLDQLLAADEMKRNYNRKIYIKRCKWLFLEALLIILFLILFFGDLNIAYNLSILSVYLFPSFHTVFFANNKLLSKVFSYVHRSFPLHQNLWAGCAFFFILFFIFFFKIFLVQEKPVMSKAELQALREQYLFVKLCNKRCLKLHEMYINYSKQTD